MEGELLARGFITLADVVDGYTLSLTTPSVSITADHDGSNPDLTNAKTYISLIQGEQIMDFKITKVLLSDPEITYDLQQTEDKRWMVAITGIPKALVSGYLEIHVSASTGYNAVINFNFSVARNLNNVRWIQEWGGTATEIGEDYVVTPKLFAGHKTTEGKLTGIYLGNKTSMPSDSGYPFSGSTSEGIYGFKEDQIIFFIDNNGASIGGWDITPGVIQNTDGTIKISADGGITSQTQGQVHWALNQDGSVSFANNNVRMASDGSAYFAGEINAKCGIMANWTIGENAIYNDYVSVNSTNRFIAISNGASETKDGTDQSDIAKHVGGVVMHYTSETDYGFACYDHTGLVFSAGSVNKIGGWYFTKASMYLGTSTNRRRSYAERGITIGSAGLRGTTWYIDSDGATNFGRGAIQLDNRGGTIAGWSIDFDSIYIGDKVNSIGALTDTPFSITIGTQGIRGNTWRLDSNGTGSLAKDNIKWDMYGNLEFSQNVKLQWQNGIDIANGIMIGKMLNRDPEFYKTGANGTTPYLNNVTRFGAIDNYAPNSSHKILRMVNTKWSAIDDARLGGLQFGTPVRPFAKFYVKIVAKIPSLWRIQNYNVQEGKGVITRWLTPQSGTDKYEEYVCEVRCMDMRDQSDFTTLNKFALEFVNNAQYTAYPPTESLSIKYSDNLFQRTVVLKEVVWDIAYATVFDSTASEKFTTTIDANGIYTGTLTAQQINALACTFDKGTIGGWKINKDSISKGDIILGVDGSITNGNLWKMNKDGSGQLANGNIYWTKEGQIHRTSPEVIDWVSVRQFEEDHLVHFNYGAYIDLSWHVGDQTPFTMPTGLSDGFLVCIKQSNWITRSSCCAVLFGNFFFRDANDNYTRLLNVKKISLQEQEKSYELKYSVSNGGWIIVGYKGVIDPSEEVHIIR